MADVEQQAPVEGTPVEDVEMEGAADAGAGADEGAGEETALADIELEAPKLVSFSEKVIPG